MCVTSHGATRFNTAHRHGAGCADWRTATADVPYITALRSGSLVYEASKSSRRQPAALRSCNSERGNTGRAYQTRESGPRSSFGAQDRQAVVGIADYEASTLSPSTEIEQKSYSSTSNLQIVQYLRLSEIVDASGGLYLYEYQTVDYQIGIAWTSFLQRVSRSPVLHRGQCCTVCTVALLVVESFDRIEARGADRGIEAEHQTDAH